MHKKITNKINPIANDILRISPEVANIGND